MRFEDELLRSRLDDPSPVWLQRDDLRDAAVLLLLVERDGVDHLVFQQRPVTLPSHPGQIAFPGGARDAEDEDALSCALRETEEEIGVPARAVDVLGRLRQRISIAGYMVTPFVGRLDRPRIYAPEPGEVDEVFEIPAAPLLEPGRWSFRANRRPLAKVRRVPFFEWEGRIVWGLTAIILRDFLRAVLGQAPVGALRAPGAPEPGGATRRPRGTSSG